MDLRDIVVITHTYDYIVNSDKDNNLPPGWEGIKDEDSNIN